jgi:hypothetical protein
VLKSAYGRQNHHTLSGLCVCCERALKSAGERSTHGGVGAGTFGKPPARGAVGVARLAISGNLAAGVIPCWQITGCALGERLRRSQLACAHAVLADHNLNITHYIALLVQRVCGGCLQKPRGRSPRRWWFVIGSYTCSLPASSRLRSHIRMPIAVAVGQPGGGS